ncbi:MAG: tetratricopeptide repeat protein [Roseibacillus sp.]
MMRLLFSFLLSFSLWASAQEAGDVSSFFPLQHVLVGEEALLNIQVIEEQPSGALNAKEESALIFSTLQPDVLGRRIFSGNIGVSSKVAGTFQVPAFEVPLKSGTEATQSFSMEVFPTDKIEWKTLNIGSDSHRIGTIVLFPSGPIYAGQSVPITAKVLFPVDLPVGSTGFAEIEKDNIGAWRLEAPSPPNYDQQVNPRPPHALRPRQVRIDGRRYQVANYVTFAAPLGDGLVTVGPGKIQGLQVQVQSRNQRPGFFSSFSRSYNVELELPAVSFTAKALPKGAPAGFQGAVGDFNLEASLDITTELKPGDPVMVDLTVSGQGNLDTLAPPVIDAPESNWKLYPTSRNEKDGARRTNQGSVSFSQILRPMVPIKEVPSFTLAFFNPKTAKYETLRSEPIPLNLSPADSISNGIPQAGLVPIAEMQDILGLIPPKPFQAREPFRIGLWWQLIPALIVLALLALIAKRQLPKLKRSDSSKDRLRSELQDLEKEKNSGAFLRAAGHLAESQELPSDDFLNKLFEERDQNCFQPGEAKEELPRKRRQEIISGLKERLGQIILLGTLLLISHPSTAEAFDSQAQTAWEKGNYQESLDATLLSLKDETTPDLLYNAGSSYYRLGEPGKAALYYHRALALDPSHPESRQNLAFLERKMGAIPQLEDDNPIWAQRLNTPLLNNLLLLLMWLFIIFLLIRFVRPSSRVQKVSTLGLIVTVMLTLLMGAIRFFHPGPPASLTAPNAVLISKESTEVRTEPSAGGSVILNAPPTTSCRILTERGNWSYIELPNGSRGWLEGNTLESI